MAIDTSIIISTYNSPEWLEKVLHGYNNQTYRHFEIVIADDGSQQDTLDLIQQMQSKVYYNIIHVWHEDNGFQKSKILNKAIVKCATPYIIMSDGDCIPRTDFVEQHVKFRERGYFLSGGYFMLNMEASQAITTKDVYEGNCFNISWLKERRIKASLKSNKLTSSGFTSWLFNNLTPTKASWNGHNSSGWKDDILAVNGFDQRMQYGGQDRELGERLINFGIKSKQIRYSAICVHLDHKRGYKNEESIAKNRKIRNETKAEIKSWSDFGIVNVTIVDKVNNLKERA